MSLPEIGARVASKRAQKSASINKGQVGKVVKHYGDLIAVEFIAPVTIVLRSDEIEPPLTSEQLDLLTPMRTA